ncbi:ABC transporter substrate-binding protein [Dyadobacter tibetensis]|uniref:ABC transporter substrate-binding protein n=1 Tax=Dyadobacter tibetensis TaxID=1211851 RepID=UPI000470580A|nr:ABC transporter substrate-binding protein [Dyadobacter tibetensis]
MHSGIKRLGSAVCRIRTSILLSHIVPILLYGSLISGCSSTASRKEGPDRPLFHNDLFAHKTSIDYAKGFTLSYHGNYKVIQIFNPFEQTADTATFVLLQRGTKRPPGFESAQVIDIPIRSLVTMSSMHVGLAGFLEAEDIIVGMGNLKYVSSPKVLEKIAKKEIVEVGKNQMLNEELLISLHPDLIMAMGSPVSPINRYPALQEAKVPVLVNSEWVETSPLARAEWVKLMAVLLNKEEQVNVRFGKVEREYKRLKALTSTLTIRPEVLCGLNSKDTWYVPSGDGYVHKFIQDAGGSYHWAETRSIGNLPLNFEQVYPVGLRADFWINLNMGERETKSELLAKDQRYSDFKAFQKGQVYAFTKRLNRQGANDYWESGAVNPQEILADLIRILHPELLPNHDLKYYKPIL